MPGTKSKFLNSNFKSLNISEEEKKKLAEQIKKMQGNITGTIGGSISDKEMKMLEGSIPKGLSDIAAFKKLLEEEKDK